MADAESDLAEVIESLRDREYVVTEPSSGVLEVTGRFSNPERIALAAAADAHRPIAVWALNQRDDWALVAWARPDLVSITQKGATPRRWRHRRIPVQMHPNAQTFLDGAASRFDIVTHPKHQPTDEAREVLTRFGIDDPAPPGWTPTEAVPQEPVARVVPVSAKRTPSERTTRAAAKTRSPAKPTRPEPTVAVCPTCYMALPATGVCDNC